MGKLFLKKGIKSVVEGREGFTLIEMILVMVIVSLAFIGIYTLFAKTFNYDLENRKETIAANLAQEGVEMTRNLRDEYLLNLDADEDPNYQYIDGTCNPYLRNNGSVGCGSSSQVKITNAGVYTQNCAGCSATDFERVCTRVAVSSSQALRVTCTVSWDSAALGGSERSVQARAYFTNWPSLR
jgi:prepilin-type N-terminal cleavage/methylation domain-containing protein